jgi:hypothetical protein
VPCKCQLGSDGQQGCGTDASGHKHHARVPAEGRATKGKGARLSTHALPQVHCRCSGARVLAGCSCLRSTRGALTGQDCWTGSPRRGRPPEHPWVPGLPPRPQTGCGSTCLRVANGDRWTARTRAAGYAWARCWCMPKRSVARSGTACVIASRVHVGTTDRLDPPFAAAFTANATVLLGPYPGLLTMLMGCHCHVEMEGMLMKQYCPA